MMQDAYRLQLKLFLYEVKQQQLLSGVRSFLKLYSTISIGKLAQYMEVDESTLRSVRFFILFFFLLIANWYIIRLNFRLN